MPHVFSNPELKWEGFKPVGYLLDTEAGFKLPLKKSTEENNPDAGSPTTIREVMECYPGAQLESGYRVDTLKTRNGDIFISGAGFSLNILRMIFEFINEGLNPFNLNWYWYDSSSCLEEPIEHYTFFVVADGKGIVREHVRFSDSPGAGFDPTVFTFDDSEPMWSGEKAREVARCRYWYRKFYNETACGQLMTLRPDCPILHYYADDHDGELKQPVPAQIQETAESRAMLNSVQKSLRTMEGLLWFLSIAVLFGLIFR